MIGNKSKSISSIKPISIVVGGLTMCYAILLQGCSTDEPLAEYNHTTCVVTPNEPYHVEKLLIWVDSGSRFLEYRPEDVNRPKAINLCSLLQSKWNYDAGQVTYITLFVQKGKEEPQQTVFNLEPNQSGAETEELFEHKY